MNFTQQISNLSEREGMWVNWKTNLFILSELSNFLVVLPCMCGQERPGALWQLGPIAPPLPPAPLPPLALAGAAVDEAGHHHQQLSQAAAGTGHEDQQASREETTRRQRRWVRRETVR